MRKSLSAFLRCLPVVAILAVPTSSFAASVGIDLTLLVDVSGSIDSTEYAEQTQGYVDAFNNPIIQNLIANTPGGVRVNFIEWSGQKQQKELVPFTLLTTQSDAAAFATAISKTTRAFTGGLTAPGPALDFAVTKFDFTTNPALKQIIDVSGDGPQDDPAVPPNADVTAAARNAALTAGIDEINALVILGDPAAGANFQSYESANIQGGTGSFTLVVSGFDTFDTGIKAKLALEIGGVPEPSSIVLLGSCMLGLAWLARRRLARNS